MPVKAEKTIRVVKRRERLLPDSRSQRSTPRTPAQVRRELVSTIVSWINDRQSSQRQTSARYALKNPAIVSIIQKTRL